MYGPSGHAYVYFIYGMYFCLNAVTEADGTPGAVLMRAIWPQEGVAIMRARRRRASAPPGGDTESQPKGDIPDRHLADGPGKLCQALGITREQNGLDLTTGRELFIEAQPAVPPAEIIATPRVGVKGNHDARARPWRFLWQPATCP
jgi:DNA-3-methyladenine glycosylase